MRLARFMGRGKYHRWGHHALNPEYVSELCRPTRMYGQNMMTVCEQADIPPDAICKQCAAMAQKEEPTK